MNKLLVIFSLVFLIFGCSEDDENIISDENTDEENSPTYDYTLQKAFHPKITVEAGPTNNRTPISKSYSYTVDTLEVNMTNNSGLLFNLEIQAYETTTMLSSELVHFNYLKFINITEESSGNSPVNKIFLTESKFTYSESNVDLNNIYPNLFVTNIHTNTTYSPEKITFDTKHPNYLRSYSSSEFYEIGRQIDIFGIYYNVISID